jgi:hypothetical protein
MPTLLLLICRGIRKGESALMPSQRLSGSVHLSILALGFDPVTRFSARFNFGV